MELDKKALGERICQYREKRGITQMKLAEDLDVSPTHVSYMEKGKRGLTLERLILVANVLHVSTDQLLMDYLENEVYPMSRTILKIRGHRIPQIC